MKGNYLEPKELESIKNSYVHTTVLNDEEIHVVSKSDYDALVKSVEYLSGGYHKLKKDNKKYREEISKLKNPPKTKTPTS